MSICVHTSMNNIVSRDVTLSKLCVKKQYNTIQYNTIILLLNLKYIHETLTIFNRLSTEREREREKERKKERKRRDEKAIDRKRDEYIY